MDFTKEELDQLLDRWDQTEPELKRLITARFAYACYGFKELLDRLLQWDHFDAAGDGDYWRKEIRDRIRELTGKE